MRAAAQDALNVKQLSSLTCTLPFLFYNHKNLLLEIHTSVRVVIMCQRVESGGGRAVIFMAEQEIDGGQHILKKKEKKKNEAGLVEISTIFCWPGIVEKKIAAGTSQKNHTTTSPHNLLFWIKNLENH